MAPKPEEKKKAPQKPVAQEGDAPRGGRATPADAGYATVNDTNEDGGAIRHTE
jgi:hypothetical protein